MLEISLSRKWIVQHSGSHLGLFPPPFWIALLIPFPLLLLVRHHWWVLPSCASHLVRVLLVGRLIVCFTQCHTPRRQTCDVMTTSWHHKPCTPLRARVCPLWLPSWVLVLWIWILLDDVYVDFCRGTSASGCPVLLFTYIHFTRSWVGLKGRPCSQSWFELVNSRRRHNFILQAVPQVNSPWEEAV